MFHAYVTERFYQAVKTHDLRTFIVVVRILKGYSFSDAEMHSHGHRNHAKSNSPGTEQHMPMLFHDNKTNKQKLASSRTYEERQVVAAGVGGKEDVGTEESDI